MLFKKRYYFTITKFPNSLRLRVVHVLYLKNGKFHYDNNVYSQYLLSWPQAMKYKFLFWWHSHLGTSHQMFYYRHGATGYIKLQKHMP